METVRRLAGDELPFTSRISQNSFHGFRQLTQCWAEPGTVHGLQTVERKRVRCSLHSTWRSYQPVKRFIDSAALVSPAFGFFVFVANQTMRQADTCRSAAVKLSGNDDRSGKPGVRWGFTASDHPVTSRAGLQRSTISRLPHSTSWLGRWQGPPGPVHLKGKHRPANGRCFTGQSLASVKGRTIQAGGLDLIGSRTLPLY